MRLRAFRVLHIITGPPVWLSLKIFCTLLLGVMQDTFFYVFDHIQMPVELPNYTSKLHRSPVGCFKLLKVYWVPFAVKNCLGLFHDSIS